MTIRAAGPITFGPDGILFLADNPSATVFAVDIADTAADPGSLPAWAVSRRTS